MSRVAVAFVRRNEALVPTCVVGVGAAARALAERALLLEDTQLRELTGVTTRDAIVLLGAPEALPWVDGVRYLGRDPEAPLLLLPTEIRPDVPSDVLERAIVRQNLALAPPVAVLADPPTLITVAAARPVERAALRRWLDAAP
jgi:hypothetical protein